MNLSYSFHFISSIISFQYQRTDRTIFSYSAKCKQLNLSKTYISFFNVKRYQIMNSSFSCYIVLTSRCVFQNLTFHLIEFSLETYYECEIPRCSLSYKESSFYLKSVLFIYRFFQFQKATLSNKYNYGAMTAPDSKEHSKQY